MKIKRLSTAASLLTLCALLFCFCFAGVNPQRVRAESIKPPAGKAKRSGREKVSPTLGQSVSNDGALVQIILHLNAAPSGRLNALLQRNGIRVKDHFAEFNASVVELPLNVIAVTAPPLREKREDVAVLAQHFLRVYAAKNNRTLAGFSDDALRCLEGYAWPGNVRELENVVERAVVLARGNTVEVGDLPDKITENAIVLERPAPGETAGDGGGEGMLRIRVGTPLAEVEQRMLEETLRMTRGNKTLTAKLLGIDPKTVFRKLKAAEDEEAGSGEPGGTERPGA